MLDALSRAGGTMRIDIVAKAREFGRKALA
jgi:hypothetical protein